MSDLIQYVVPMMFIAILFVVPGIYTLFSRAKINKNYSKALVYFCAEISLTPKQWPEIKEKIINNKNGTIRVPFSTLTQGLLSPIWTGIGTLSMIWQSALVLIMAAFISIDNLALQGFFGDVFVYLFFAVIALTVFLFYFRAVSSEQITAEERSTQVVNYLLQVGWKEMKEKDIGFLKERIKTDHDLYRSSTGLGGIFLIIFSSSVLLVSRFEGGGMPIYILSSLFLISLIVVCKWMYESNRSRIIHISLNALIMLEENNSTDR